MKRKLLLFAAMVMVLMLALCSCGTQTPSDDGNGGTGEDTSNQEQVIEEEEIQAVSVDELRNTISDNNRECGLAYMGYAEGAENAQDVLISLLAYESVVSMYTFIEEIPEDRVVLTEGYDIYCLVPKDDDYSVTVETVTLGDGGQLVKGEEIYSGDGQPILIKCNISDIVPNVAITIDNGEDSFEYSPFISLENGTLDMGDAKDKIYDFTSYYGMAVE